MESQTDKDVHDLLYLHFVRPGLVEPSLAKAFAALQKYREQADYARAFRFDETGAPEEFERPREICTAIQTWLKKNNWIETEPR